MAKLPEGRSTLTDEQMIGLTHRLVDTCIDCKGKIEELEERLKAAQDDAKEAEAYAEELETKLAKTKTVLLAAEGLAKASELEWEARAAWEDLPTDRGGTAGPKGQALRVWHQRRAELNNALAAYREATK